MFALVPLDNHVDEGLSADDRADDELLVIPAGKVGSLERIARWLKLQR